MNLFPHLHRYKNLRYGFSTREDGSMHRHLEKENRERYWRMIGIDPRWVVTADLNHGIGAVKVGEKEGGAMIPETDALVTKEKNVFLSATAADCALLYLYDPKKEIVGIAHAGWRGILKEMPKVIIRKMKDEFGSNLEDIYVGISPAIQKCHFKISPEDAELFKEYPRQILEEDGVFVDLPGIIKTQLLAVGIQRKNIEDKGICTACEKNTYFSYRRDKPKDVQPMLGYIGMV